MAGQIIIPMTPGAATPPVAQVAPTAPAAPANPPRR
jgi:hypothetical protein